MSARDELLAALTAERYDNRWWKTPESNTNRSASTDLQAHYDDDVTRARRRRELLAATEGYEEAEHAG